MKISQNGINFIKQWETLQLHAYRGEGEQYYTIGWGHYGADVSPGMVITEEKANELLKNDLAQFVTSTNNIALKKFPELNQNQFDALVSYCYNRGAGGLTELIRNSNSIEEISENFIVYWGTNTSAQEGLLNRRKKEQELFNTPYSDTPDNSKIIENVIAWMLKIAEDDSHGYDQTNRWGPDYDCSSFVISAWEQAGVKVKTAGATNTSDIKSVFLANGFVLGDINNLIRGDIILKEGHHVVTYLGDNKIVHASINENGATTGGQSGDQTGKEICTRDYYNYEGGWDCVLRYQSSGSSGDTPVTPTESGEVWEKIKQSHYNTKQLSESQIKLLKTLSFGDSVKMKYTYNRRKKEIGTNIFGKKLKFDTKSYIIKSVNASGFIILQFATSNCFKIINPKYIRKD